MANREGAFPRAWSDLKSTTRSWWFGILAALLTAGFAALGAILPPKAGLLERVALAVAGTLGGALFLGLLAFIVLVAKAPTRQRDEARDELERLTATSVSDSAVLIERFSTWLQAKRATLPGYPNYTGPVFLFNREADEKRQVEYAAAQQRYEATYDEVKRQARAEYHDQLRADVLALIGEGHEKARNPQTFQDLEVVETLLLAAKPVSPEDLAAFKDFAQRFGGWLRSHEITAPPDMIEVLGTQYEDEQARKVVKGELSADEYQRRVQAFTERRRWAQQLRAGYQRDWRAEVARRFAWAREAGVMEREDYMALVLLENPQADDLKELVTSAERMAGRL